jgi:hypothetical protein
VAEKQANLLQLIDERKDDPAFIKWAYENYFWLQIEDEQIRLITQFEFLKKYLLQVVDSREREKIILDYILEQEYFGLTAWVAQGKTLLEEK